MMTGRKEQRAARHPGEGQEEVREEKGDRGAAGARGKGKVDLCSTRWMSSMTAKSSFRDRDRQ